MKESFHSLRVWRDEALCVRRACCARCRAVTRASAYLCKPPDMRSFITSYLSATLWNTCSAITPQAPTHQSLRIIIISSRPKLQRRTCATSPSFTSCATV